MMREIRVILGVGAGHECGGGGLMLSDDGHWDQEKNLYLSHGLSLPPVLRTFLQVISLCHEQTAPE